MEFDTARIGSQTPGRRCRATNRKTQRGKLLRRLIDARGAWVSLPDILTLGIAQYNARVFELRRLGFVIENRAETDPATGVRHSWFRLAQADIPSRADAPKAQATSASGDWYEREHGQHPSAKVEEDELLPLFVGSQQ